MAPPNALFAIMNVSDPEGLKRKLDAIDDWSVLNTREGQWLVVAPSSTTTKEMSERLGFFDESSLDTALILRVRSIHGRTFASVWEWIETKQGAELGSVPA